MSLCKLSKKFPIGAKVSSGYASNNGTIAHWSELNEPFHPISSLYDRLDGVAIWQQMNGIECVIIRLDSDPEQVVLRTASAFKVVAPTATPKMYTQAEVEKICSGIRAEWDKDVAYLKEQHKYELEEARELALSDSIEALENLYTRS